MAAVDVAFVSSRALLAVSGGMFSFTFGDSLATPAAASAPMMFEIPLLSWAGVVALLGVAVEWGRVRENLRATNQRLTDVEKTLVAMQTANTTLQASVNFLTQALAARGYIPFVAPPVPVPSQPGPAGAPR